MEPIKVKLGTTSYGFYHLDTARDHTMIQKDKMAYNVLSILSKSDSRILMGTIASVLNDELLELQPELAVDDYGESTTLPSLIKDLRAGDLLLEKYDNKSSKVQISDLGREFLRCNVVA